MDILERIQNTACHFPDRIAIRTGKESLTYGQLWEFSGRLAVFLRGVLDGRKNAGQKDPVPVAVYGHKSPWMLVCFLGLIRSGHGYCPVDISVPGNRVKDILRSLASPVVLAVEPLPDGLNVECGPTSSEGEFLKEFPLEKEELTLSEISLAQIREWACDAAASCVPDASWSVSGNDIFYLIFTSGSTGVPKGVQISSDGLNHFLDWSITLTRIDPDQKQEAVFLNQAPFSFDLSVMDLYTCLAAGGTLFCLQSKVQASYRLLMEEIQKANPDVWVSTPSFAELCLADPSFSEKLLPRLSVFLFCGETLSNRTAGKLLHLFTRAAVYNTYGPTESTVAVTGIEVTEELLQKADPLPVGYPKPGTCIQIRDDGGNLLSEGEKGEIVILGDTVSPGYYRQKELSDRVFFRDPEGINGYRTGDKGYLKDGCLYYCGRIDLQIKLHGYRMELEDIESNLIKVDGIERAVVVPNERGGKVSSLTAYLVEESGEYARQDNREKTARVRERLGELLPAYMIPKKIVFVDQIPMTANGKADRKRLVEMCLADLRRNGNAPGTGGNKHGLL